MPECANEMVPLERDLSVFQKLDLQKQPVGVKFLFARPEGIARLDKILSLCEMVPEAQTGKVFYADLQNHECAGPIPLGMVDPDPFIHSGQIGPCLEVFREARANRRVYELVPSLRRGTCNFMVFSALDLMTFNPDVLVLSGTARQMEIVLRAMSYTTGQLYESKSTSVMGCAWTLVYPYLSGKINFSVAGLAFGQISRGMATDGTVSVSVPWDCLPTMVENLQVMNWIPPSYTEGRENHRKRFERITSGSRLDPEES